MPIERHTTPSLTRRTVQYLIEPGGIPKVLGVAVAVGTLASIPFVHPSLRQAAGGLGAAWMLWWLGFKARENSERGSDE